MKDLFKIKQKLIESIRECTYKMNRMQYDNDNENKDNNNNEVTNEVDILGTTLNQDLSEFMNKLQYHRDCKLNNKIQLQKEFDEMWGINPETGHFRCDTDELTLLDRLTGNLVHKTHDVHDMIVKDLMMVRKKAVHEIEYFDLPNISNKERGERLMNLFQQDMLPGLSAQIVESTSK